MNEQKNASRPGTVAIVHFFSERTDGVSLQIQENNRVLTENGWKVIGCSADATGENSFLLPELDYSTPQAQIFKRVDLVGTQDVESIEKAFEALVLTIKEKLGEMIAQYHPQVIHLRNILSLPIHPAATVAMAECIAAHPNVGFLAQHHDFSFEDDFVPGDRKKAYTIPYPAIQKRVEDSLLYRAPNVHNATINSIMQKELERRFGLYADVIPDSFDFGTKPLEIADLREKVGIGANDLVVGTMARIIPRKAMEVAVAFIAELQKRQGELIGENRGVHGRTVTETSKILLLLPQSAGLDEPDNAVYFNKLRQYAEQLGVEVRYIGDKIVADNAYKGEPDKIPFYSIYSIVDMLAFPSYQEGFGNQFLEAAALGSGMISAHAYPVMEADILPRISIDGVVYLGNNAQYTLDEIGLTHLETSVLQAAVDRQIHFLLNPDEEMAAATSTRQKLKEAFDAVVVGDQISGFLLKAIPNS